MAVDGMDVLAVEKAAQEAVDKVRTTGKPFFLVCNTYRFRAHSMFDSELYRARSEVEEWKKKDPIPNLQQNLQALHLLTEAEFSALQVKAEEQVQKAVAFAEAGTWEPVDSLTRHVSSEASR